jgi:3-polyprenyl-4-hydroxybenzoate decarboxylase
VRPVRLCSVKLLAPMQAGYGVGPIVRAAGAILKKRRRSVMVLQEPPPSEIHLDNTRAPRPASLDATVNCADATTTARENSDG